MKKKCLSNSCAFMFVYGQCNRRAISSQRDQEGYKIDGIFFNETINLETRLAGKIR